MSCVSGPPARLFLGLPAPAKLNLFLHVLGRRADGYHEIESVFAPVDLCDTLDFELRGDGRVVRSGDLTGPPEEDLAVRAALALRGHAVRSAGLAGRVQGLGATIEVTKRIPVGAGLGGGSSDAATTLIALNRLWDLRLARADLARIAGELGADVPFFLGPGPAYVEGKGERCTPLRLPAAWYVIVFPGAGLSTAAIFSDPKLTRNRKRTTIAGFSDALSRGGIEALVGFGGNDLEPVARAQLAAVDAALAAVAHGGAARMTGSGSAVFGVRGTADDARRLLAAVRERIPAQWGAWAVAGLAELPLAAW